MILLRSEEFYFSFLLPWSRGFPTCSFYSWLIEIEVIQEVKLILPLLPKYVKCKQRKEQEIERAMKWRAVGAFLWWNCTGSLVLVRRVSLDPRVTTFFGLWPLVRGLGRRKKVFLLLRLFNWNEFWRSKKTELLVCDRFMYFLSSSASQVGNCRIIAQFSRVILVFNISTWLHTQVFLL